MTLLTLGDTMICGTCQQDKPDTDFSWKNKKLNKRNTKCKCCQNDYAQQHYQNNKEKYKTKARINNAKYLEANKQLINEVKSKGCSLCSETEPCCMDFHHIDPNTKIDTVSRIALNATSIQTLQAEIDKCVVLCSNCHRKVHRGILSIK